MAGFTLYETLRILVPGGIAVAIFDLVIRMALGVSPTQPDGAKALVTLIEGTGPYLSLSLAMGLLLYLVDLPSKTRLHIEGDPGRGLPVPSAYLRHMLGPGWKDPISTYFLLSDRYLPDDTHRRVYLFGSLYRIYVDFRALLMCGVVLGVTLSLANTPRTSTASIDAEAIGVISICLAILAGVGSYGSRLYYRRASEKREREGREAEKPARWRREVAAILPPAAVLAILTASGFMLVARRDAPTVAMGTLLQSVVILLWAAVEIGPPKESESRTFAARMMGALGATMPGATQYSPLQRSLCDVAILVPAFCAVGVANAGWGRRPAEIFVWLSLALPMTLILSFRKHEERLVQSYGTQCSWLETHRKDVEVLKASGNLPDRWNGG